MEVLVWSMGEPICVRVRLVQQSLIIRTSIPLVRASGTSPTAGHVAAMLLHEQLVTVVTNIGFAICHFLPNYEWWHLVFIFRMWGDGSKLSMFLLNALATSVFNQIIKWHMTYNLCFLNIRTSPCAWIKFRRFTCAMEHSQVSVCVFQYSRDRSVTPLRVWMGATATSGMEATAANANTDTGGSIVRKVPWLIRRLEEHIHMNLQSTIIKTPFRSMDYQSSWNPALVHQETCRYS